MTSRREVRWITEDVGRIFPRECERFSAEVPAALKDRPLVDAYAKMLFDPDPTVRDSAAQEWCAWEDAHVSLAPGHRPNPRFQDPLFRLGFARLVTHYWSNAGFLDDEQLIDAMELLRDIPGELIHGRFDVSSPLETAWRIAKRWPAAKLRILDDAGHGGGSLNDAILDALDRLTENAPR
jgi:proline iminopeptidase